MVEPGPDTQPKLGRSAPRSKEGCNTCLTRKIKCDENRPKCHRCDALQLDCEWVPRVRKRRSASGVKKKDAQLSRRIPSRPIQPLPSKVKPRSLDIAIHDDPASPLPVSTDPQSIYSETSFSAPANEQELTWLWINIGSSPWPVSPSFAFSRSISPCLSTQHIPCANSLLLSPHDRRCLEYYPSSTMVVGYLKPWRWSNLSYIYERTAASDPMLMRMILAISASEMHRTTKPSTSTIACDSHDVGLHHYNLAVRELSGLLAQKNDFVANQRMERLLPTLLFMVDYEVKFGYSRHHLRLHLEGVRSLLKSYENSLLNCWRGNDGDDENEPATQLSLLSCQMLLWIAYIDAVGGQGLSSTSLLTRMSRSSLPALNLDRIYRNARVCGRTAWSSEYPDDELLDDLENYRPLEALHHTFVMRSKIWEVTMAKSEGRECVDTSEKLAGEIHEIGEKYRDIFMTANMPWAGKHRRVFNTIRCAASAYWTQVLFHRRMLYSHLPRTELHLEAVEKIMQIAHIDYAVDRKYIVAQVSGLFMAGIETQNAVHRDWILERLGELKGLHLEGPWASEVLERSIRSGNAEDIDFMSIFQLDYKSATSKP